MSNDHDGTEDAWNVGDDSPRAGADVSSTPETGDVSLAKDTSPADDPANTADTDTADTDTADDDGADDDGTEVDSTAEPTVSGDDEGALVGAGVAAGSARAAARRSAAVKAGISEKKGRATAGREEHRNDRGNVVSRLMRFLREVVSELKKVIWPGQKQMITYSSVVIVFVVFMIALVYGLDALFAQGVLAIFG